MAASDRTGSLRWPVLSNAPIYVRSRAKRNQIRPPRESPPAGELPVHLGAILAIGAMAPKPVVRDGQIVVRQTMRVTMSCDHRVVDGATGAQFLQTFKQVMENPLYLFLAQ